MCNQFVKLSIIPLERLLPHLCSTICANNLVVKSSITINTNKYNFILNKIRLSCIVIDCMNKNCNQLIDIPDPRLAYIYWNKNILYCSSCSTRCTKKDRQKRDDLYNVN